MDSRLTTRLTGDIFFSLILRCIVTYCNVTQSRKSLLYRALRGFRSVDERSPEGWTPICFAVLDGNPLLVASLLEQRADVDERISQTEQLCHFPPQMPILHICSFLRNTETAKVLISHRADVAATDGYGSGAHHWAAISDNVEGMEILFAAGSNAAAVNFFGASSCVQAACAGALESTRMLLPKASRQQVQYALHLVMLHRGGSAEMVSRLIEAEAAACLFEKTCSSCFCALSQVRWAYVPLCAPRKNILK